MCLPWICVDHVRVFFTNDYLCACVLSGTRPPPPSRLASVRRQGFSPPPQRPAKTRRNKKCHERREAKRRAEVHRTHCMCLIHCTSFLYEMSRVSMYTRIRGRFLWPNRDRQFSSQYTSPIPIYTHTYMHSMREYLTRICININHFCTFTQSCPPVRQNGGGRGGAGGGPNRAPRQPFWPPR